MITLEKLPDDYVPYETLTICSNKMIGGGHIVSVGGSLPVVIGKGGKPQIWLQALVNPETNEFLPIVEASISTHPAVKVLEKDKLIIVEIQKQKVLSVKTLSKDSAEVTQLDLRPIGLNLIGDTSKLTAGSSTFSRNTMSGGGSVLIGFG
ncbi:hypothetical protein IB286_06930 [Spongiibacter sp. KMU-158]|uniref:Uncharacterized protein n=1 Tax=Spongiibacter pelagi TaxID=2760804 RepID=A0A927C232_9GAMM|nr:hypothetical protein [Spongiibacter pelagi]MBD2858743.1 hypothetical protein [Spongiibacter pelagi]